MKLLHVDSSILGEHSASRALGAAVVAARKAADPALEVTYRDLAAAPLPHLSGGSLAKADAAGIVLGARVPIILTSRADSVRTRMASCAVAVLYADARRRATELPAV